VPGQADHEADRQALDHGSVPVAEDHPSDPRRGRAEREAHADLPPAVDDDVELHAVEADHGEQQRHEPECQRPDAEALQEHERAGQHRAAAADLGDREIRVGAPHGAAKRSHRLVGL
jgi:hypothetical protein